MTSKIKVDNINKVSDDSNIINKCGTSITVGTGSDTTTVPGAATVTGDLKSDSLKAADGGVIISQSGTTITLGASGDTVTLASGASQSGFGRSGSVNWQTTIKTGNFAAASGEGYFVDTTSGAITVTLAASPTALDIVAFKDYNKNFATANLIIDPGSNKIEGSTDDMTVSTESEALTLVYIDSTQGWLVVNDGNADAGAQSAFVTATGGTITTVCTNFKVHTFNSPGTFCVSCGGNAAGNNKVDYLVIAGAGGGSSFAGGGGGAGGYRESHTPAISGCYTASPLKNACGALTVTAQGYPITVGAGGPGGAPGGTGTSGSDSIFSTVTSAGGGRGGTTNNCPGTGLAGGSGGGSARGAPGASGNTPPVTPPQGNDGGASAPYTAPHRGGGGGGAGGSGTAGNSSANTGGPGAPGTPTEITGSATTYAGGGGGGTNYPGNSSGGPGGGGNGAAGNGGAGGGAGSTNKGSGGGGGAGGQGPGGAGGSGLVIIRYKFQ